MSNFLSYGNRIVGGGGNSQSGGHVIENSTGTDLTQRDTLQFAGGLKATDDSTNGKTIVDDSPTEMTWTQWNALTPEQQAAIPKALITDAPGVDGPINVELMTKLWENPNPTSAFAAQTITLSSSDYDFLLVTAVCSTTNGAESSPLILKKNSKGILNYATATSPAAASNRTITCTSNTQLSVDSAWNAGSVVNTELVPIAVYGIKQSVTVDVSAVISDVSTDADKCMLSDGVTSVEDALTPTEYGAPADVTKTSVATGTTYLGEDIFTIPSTATRVFIQVVASGNVGGFVECMKGLPTIAFDLSHVAEARVLWNNNTVVLSYIYNGSEYARDIGLSCRYI